MNFKYHEINKSRSTEEKVKSKHR